MTLEIYDFGKACSDSNWRPDLKGLMANEQLADCGKTPSTIRVYRKDGSRQLGIVVAKKGKTIIDSSLGWASENRKNTVTDAIDRVMAFLARTTTKLGSIGGMFTFPQPGDSSTAVVVIRDGFGGGLKVAVQLTFFHCKNQDITPRVDYHWDLVTNKGIEYGKYCNGRHMPFIPKTLDERKRAAFNMATESLCNALTCLDNLYSVPQSTHQMGIHMSEMKKQVWFNHWGEVMGPCTCALAPPPGKPKSKPEAVVYPHDVQSFVNNVLRCSPIPFD